MKVRCQHRLQQFVMFYLTLSGSLVDSLLNGNESATLIVTCLVTVPVICHVLCCCNTHMHTHTHSLSLSLTPHARAHTRPHPTCAFLSRLAWLHAAMLTQVNNVWSKNETCDMFSVYCICWCSCRNYFTQRNIILSFLSYHCHSYVVMMDFPVYDAAAGRKNIG